MTINFNQNYFQLFEIKKNFNVDINILEKNYFELQKKFHPDKYVNATDHEKRLSLQITSYINEAYETLKDDYLKSIYLLKIEGYEFDDQNNTVSDPDFLMNQMELREESENIALKKDKEDIKRFYLKLNNLKKECLKEFEKNYCNNFFDEAEKKIKEMKFFISIENDFKKSDL